MLQAFLNDGNQLTCIMQPFPPTFIWRHRRENLRKCSLRGLEKRSDFRFFSYPNEALPDLSGYIWLTLDGPPLSLADAQFGLLILDGTWRYAEKMGRQVELMPGIIKRRIPENYRTAYPRRQDDCEDPEKGLASVEALYIAYQILGRNTDHLLDNYHWKEEFLKSNRFEAL